MISDELQERVRRAWFESIPERFRFAEGSKDNRGLFGDRLLSSAIIAKPPPPSLVEKFLLGIFGERHLTAAQAAALISKSGRRKDILTSAEVG